MKDLLQLIEDIGHAIKTISETIDSIESISPEIAKAFRQTALPLKQLLGGTAYGTLRGRDFDVETVSKFIETNYGLSTEGAATVASQKYSKAMKNKIRIAIESLLQKRILLDYGLRLEAKITDIVG